MHDAHTHFAGGRGHPTSEGGVDAFGDFEEADGDDDAQDGGVTWALSPEIGLSQAMHE